MIIENIDTIINIILKVSIAVGLFILGYKLYIFYTTKYIDIKNKEAETEKIKLYSTIDPKLVKQELVNILRDYTARYITKYIMINKIDFITNDQMEEMLKSVVKDTIIDMSDLQLSYYKLLYSINTEDDLTKAVYYLAVDVVLDIVTEFNKTK